VVFQFEVHVEWIYLAKERAQWQILVCMVLNEISTLHILN